MKKYFVTSDIHGFYTIFKKELDKYEFDINNQEHILIICGDLLDRGCEANKLLKFLNTIPKERLIIIRGNHEDLLDSSLKRLEKHERIISTDVFNGTIDTISQISSFSASALYSNQYEYDDIKKGFKTYKDLMKNALNYYEIKDYIFVHGWIPLNYRGIYYKYDKNWRKASQQRWNDARWLNGIAMAKLGFIEPDKTIVCGHYHTGYGHYNIYYKGYSEFDCFDIYENDGIIALDACTVNSKKINILIIEE